MTTRKGLVSVVVVLALVVFSVSAAFADTPVVSSLDALSSYGTWVSIDGTTNGRKTADNTTTTAEFALATGFTAQWWVSDSSNGSITKDGNERTIPTGAVASVYDETVTDNGDSGNADPADITEYSAEQLITSKDVTTLFTLVKEGTYGEIVVSIPANVKFTVHEAWSAVSVQAGDQILAGQSYTTGNSAETTTWWPNAEYLEKQNTVEITAENFAEYFTLTDAEGSKWAVATPTEKASGKKFTIGDASKVALVRNNGEVSDPDTLNPEDGEIILASKDEVSNKNGDLFNSVANITAAAPVAPTVKRQDDGKYEVVVFIGSDTLYLLGTNLFKYSYDKNTVEEVGATTAASDGVGSKMLKSKTGRAIGTITVYLSSQGNSGNGSSDGQGGGGGGCNATGASFLGLFLIPLFLRKRS